MRGLFPNIQDIESAMNDEEGTALAGLPRRGRGMQFGGANVSLFGPALLKQEMAEHSNVLVNPNDENAPYPNNGYNPRTGLEYDAADHEDTGLGEYETSAQEQEQEFEYGGEAEFDPQDDQWILGDYEDGQENDQDEYGDESEQDDESDSAIGRYVPSKSQTSNVVPKATGMLDMNMMDHNDVYSFEDHSKEYNQQSSFSGVATAQPYNNQTLRDGRNMGINIQPNVYKGADNGVYVTETRKEQIQESGVPVDQIRAQTQNQVAQFESLPQFEFGRNFMGNRFAQSMTSFIGAEDRIQPNEMMPNPRGKMAQVDDVYMGSRIRVDQGGGTARLVHGQRPQQQAHHINVQQQMVAQPQRKVLGASPIAVDPRVQQARQMKQAQAIKPQVVSQNCIVDIVDTRGARKILQAIQKCLSHMKHIAANKDQILKVQKEGNDLVAFLEASLKNNQWSEAISSRLKRLQHNISFLDSKNRARLASVTANNCAIGLNQEAKQKFAPVCMTIKEDLSWFMQSIMKTCESLCDKYCAAADRMGLKKFASCPDFNGGHALAYSLMMPSHSNIENAQISQVAKDQCAKQDCSHCVQVARVACLQPIYDSRGMLNAEACDFFELKPIKQKIASQPIIMQDQLPDAQALASAAKLDLRQIQGLGNPYIMQLLKCLVQDVREQVITMQEAVSILRKQFSQEVSQNQQIPYVLNENMKEFWGDSKLSKEEYASIKNAELKRLRSSQAMPMNQVATLAPMQARPQSMMPRR